MNEMTAQNLRSAYGGESQAHMRYKSWANKAEQEGFKNVANLFRAVSYAEEVHATNHFRALKDEAGDFQVTAGAGFGLGSTSENLQGAIDGENFEIEQMYPAYLAVAELQEEKQAKLFMKYAIEAEKTHSELFTTAKEAVDAGNDFEVEEVHVCPVCGYTFGNEEHEACPVCGVKREKFISFK
ncbi:rubrerythrin family protein [Sporosalibacterium faouarense]|uniref:rubrerythrin family protein n=1 Tax=Sporosalibacterium faouarense TaxID=516123 RepID=UPI00141CA5E3|nr:rubrerythrin family protein [Sporosalibacterium faouarense]MTI49738.1 rubrerythrin family protein [Bacillota bacterium]